MAYVEVVSNRLTREEIDLKYKMQELNRFDCLVLYATESDAKFKSLMFGFGSYSVGIPNVDSKLYPTDYNYLMHTLFRLNKQFPQYHFGEILQKFLEDISQNFRFVYHAVNIINEYLNLKRINANTFEIANLEGILNNCKNTIKANADELKASKIYMGSVKEDGLYGAIGDLNEVIKTDANYDLFDFGDSGRKV